MGTEALVDEGLATVIVVVGDGALTAVVVVDMVVVVTATAFVVAVLCAVKVVEGVERGGWESPSAFFAPGMMRTSLTLST
jgi:hypothetical protein